jgi:hypothetical protein
MSFAILSWHLEELAKRMPAENEISSFGISVVAPRHGLGDCRAMLVLTEG